MAIVVSVIIIIISSYQSIANIFVYLLYCHQKRVLSYKVQADVTVLILYLFRLNILLCMKSTLLTLRMSATPYLLEPTLCLSSSSSQKGISDSSLKEKWKKIRHFSFPTVVFKRLTNVSRVLKLLGASRDS